MRLRLRKVREAKGLSLRALAEKAGVAFTAINRMELGKTTPRLETLERLAKALRVGIKDLIVNGK
jgi:transcriptional regulator with XRE-family HTH domain